MAGLGERSLNRDTGRRDGENITGKKSNCGRSFQFHQIGWDLVRLVNSEHSDSIRSEVKKS